MNFEIFNDDKNRFGWICPKCKIVISPDFIFCPVCSNKDENEQENEFFSEDFFYLSNIENLDDLKNFINLCCKKCK